MGKAITKKELCDEDWQTQLAQGYENIPAECKEIIESSLVKKTEIVKSFGI